MALFQAIPGGSAVNGAPVMEVITQAMRDLYKEESLIDWWTADTLVSGQDATFEWRGRKNLNRLTMLFSQTSPIIVPNAFNARKALQAGTNSQTMGTLQDPTATLQPVSASYSWVWVGRKADPGNDTYLIGTDGASPSFVWLRQADNKVQVSHGNVSQGVSGGAVPPSAPHIGIWSYDHSTGTAQLRLNGGAVTGFTKTSAAPQLNPKLQIFGRGNAVSNNSAGAQNFDFFLFNKAVHTDAPLIALIDAHLTATYLP